MRGRIIGVYALLSASVLQAERVSEPYAQVGYWEITTDHQKCTMKRLYPGKVVEDEEVLMILDDAHRQVAALAWSPRKPKLPALSDSLDLQLSFLKGRSMNESWGSQPFQIAKSADTYVYIHVFKGSTYSDRFLRDLASHDTLALFFGPGLMTGLPFNASEAVTKLRECSSKLVEQDASDQLHK